MPKGQETAHADREVGASGQKKPSMQTPQSEEELNVLRNWRLLMSLTEKGY